MHSLWKVTVASSLILLLAIPAIDLHGQPSHPYSSKNITISFRHTTLEDALEDLSRKTGIGFVYSASTLEVKKLLSFSAVEQPIENILADLGRQLNLSFQWFGDHVVVKQVIPVQKTMADYSPGVGKENGKLIFLCDSCYQHLIVSTEKEMRPVQPYHFVSDRESFSYRSLSLNQRVKVRTTLDSLIFSSLSEKHLTHRSNEPSRWFASAGFFANDYTYSGLELRAGTKSLYGILNVSKTNNNLTRVGYGLGTTLSSSPGRWSFSLAYTLAKVQKEYDLTYNYANRSNYQYYYVRYLIKDAIELRSTQHQVKFAAHYSVAKRLSLQFGPTLNILNTRYRYMGEDVPITSGPYYHSTDDYLFVSLNLSERLRTSDTIIPPYTVFSYYSLDRYVNTKLWIGIEAGLAYRVNFSRTR